MAGAGVRANAIRRAGSRRAEFLLIDPTEVYPPAIGAGSPLTTAIVFLGLDMVFSKLSLQTHKG